MSIETINVTRWLNNIQEFVEVGTLFRDDSLGRKSPLIGFNYHPDYLEKHPTLLPKSHEHGMKSKTFLNSSKNNNMVPSYFKQFLPSERNKSVINALSDEFNKLDQFQQIKHMTKYRGVFGAVQLEYDASQQKNSLPKPHEAMQLLAELEKGEYNALDSKSLSAMFHPNSDSHIVSTYIELGVNHVYCNMKKCVTEREANELLFIQNMMNECGIDSPVAIKLADEDGCLYVGQMTGEQIINKNSGVSAMYNTIPVAVLLADSGYISKFESVNFSHVNKAVSSVVPDIEGEIFKRALFSHLLAQKDISDRHIKVKEVADNKWSLAPHEICKINLDKMVPFNIAISDTISAYTPIKVNEALVEMVVNKYSIDQSTVEAVMDEIATGLENIYEIAMQSGLKPSDITALSDHIINSNIRTFADRHNTISPNNGPIL